MAGALRHLVAPVPNDSLSRAARDFALMHIVRVRLVVAPLLGTVALTFAFFEQTAWRRALLIAAISLLTGLSLIEFARSRRFGLDVVLLPLNILLTALGQVLIVTATGGLFSPVIPVMMILSLVSGLLADRLTLKALIAMVLPALWTLAWVHRHGEPVPSLLPRLFAAGSEIERGPAPLLAASFFTLLVLGTAAVGSKLQWLFEQLYRDGLRERDRVLALHEESARTLTTLTGEIAHELKNPLSSVKGLAALVAKDVEGRTAERLAVLRKEVDRMQAILEEFLNFSRPLVPLSLAPIDLAELARDVVRLHEGSALERGVALSVQGRKAARLRGDLRKIRQVLINVIQNAIEASAAGDEIRVQVAEAAAGLSVRVADQGPGLPVAIGGRIFEAGVTTKEHGSGLGLVVARALARQHGGELTLQNGEAGGAVAELTLPFEPPGAAS